MTARRCCEDRPFCTHAVLLVTLVGLDTAANDASFGVPEPASPPRVGARSIASADATSAAPSSAALRADVVCWTKELVR